MTGMMNRFRQIHAKRWPVLLAAALLFASVFAFPKSASADNKPGTYYELDGSLSCYVDAMGGIEFGGPLLTGVNLYVDESGNEYIQITLTKGSVEIYSVVADTFVDVDPSYVTDDRGITNGTLGIYYEDGTLVTDDVSYTLSDDTALNPNEDEVNYVDSVTFPIDSERDTYNLTMYINSNTMGVQFCNANDAATTTTYEAVLTVDWSGLTAAASDGGDSEEAEAADGDADETADASDETADDAADTGDETELVADEEYPGLTIYEVGGDDTEEDAADSDTDDSGMSGVEKNAKAFAIVLVIAIVLTVVGLVLLYFARQQERRNRGVLRGRNRKEDSGAEKNISKNKMTENGIKENRIDDSGEGEADEE